MTDLIQWPARGGTRGIRLGFSVKDKDGKRKSFTYEAGQEEVPARVGGQENISSSGRKKIKYAYKAKSAKIREAKSSAAVSELCARLSAEIKDLIEKLKSGEYDQTEILRALMHAERLEAAALKKLQDLRTEEAAERAMKSKKGQQQTMTSMPVWLFLLPWTLMGLKIFCNGFKMQEFLSQITKEIQVRVFLVQKKNQNSAMRT